MIEKYFKKGIRFNWNKSGNVDGTRDGAIVDGIRPTGEMTYIGLGEVVDPILMTSHVSTFGLTKDMTIQHKWLDYTPGRTSRVPIGPYDVLTGYMSGCIIAKWYDRGVNYVGHIGTVESDPTVNTLVKTTFGNAMPDNCTGFNPALAFTFNDLEAIMRETGSGSVPQICALVTTRGDFYATAMMHEGNGEYFCCGLRTCPTINNVDLRAFLT